MKNTFLTSTTFFYLLPPCSAEEWGMGAVVCPLLLCCSFVVTLCPCSMWVPPMGCRPYQTDPAWASCGLQFSKHCSNVAPYHGAQASWVQYSGMGPHYCQVPQPFCPTVGSSPQAAAPAWGLFIGCGLLQPHQLLHRVLIYGCMCRSAPCGASGLQEDRLLHHGPFLDCWELLLCNWSTSCPLSAQTLAPAGCSSHSLTTLSYLLLCSRFSLS